MKKLGKGTLPKSLMAGVSGCVSLAYCDLCSSEGHENWKLYIKPGYHSFLQDLHIMLTKLNEFQHYPSNFFP